MPLALIVGEFLVDFLGRVSGLGSRFRVRSWSQPTSRNKGKTVGAVQIPFRHSQMFFSCRHELKVGSIAFPKP